MLTHIARIWVILALSTSLAYGAQATRASGFSYDSSSGLLTKEAIEPGDSNLCLVTTYGYDAFGNKNAATTRNCNASSGEAAAPTGDSVFTARSSSAAFDSGSVTISGTTYNYSSGQFQTSATNALSQAETRQFDPRFGAMKSLTGPNSLTTSWTYDTFGRKTQETRADGTTTAWTYTVCTYPCSGTSTGAYFVTQTTTGAPTVKVYYDPLNREIRTETQGFDGTAVNKDTQYDSQGRVSQVSRPYYTGSTPAWTVFGYDILGRVTSQTDPNNAVTTTTYNGLTTTVTNALNQSEVRTKNSQGQLIQVTRQ